VTELSLGPLKLKSNNYKVVRVWNASNNNNNMKKKIKERDKHLLVFENK
jgi:hypothetical protein